MQGSRTKPQPPPLAALYVFQQGTTLRFIDGTKLKFNMDQARVGLPFLR